MLTLEAQDFSSNGDEVTASGEIWECMNFSDAQALADAHGAAPNRQFFVFDGMKLIAESEYGSAIISSENLRGYPERSLRERELLRSVQELRYRLLDDMSANKDRSKLTAHERLSIFPVLDRLDDFERAQGCPNPDTRLMSRTKHFRKTFIEDLATRP